MRKNAQIKMFETIGVLVVFFFMLGIGIIFFASIQHSSTTQKVNEAVGLKTIALAELAGGLPELDCSNKKNCFDWLKAEAFFEIMSNDENMMQDYAPILGTSRIELIEVYPLNRSLLLYDSPIENANVEKAAVPVLINHPDTEKDSFGVLEVGVYAKP